MNDYSLDGLWRFQPDPHDDGKNLGFFRSDYDFRFWREAMVPSCFDSCLPELEQYIGVCWYRSISLPDIILDDDQRLLLCFEAVNNHAEVWVNGSPAGEHHDPFLPFELDITQIVDGGKIESIVVRVDNSHHPGDVPGMHTGWHQAGGIIREVRLAAVEKVCLADVSVTADHLGNTSVIASVSDYTTTSRNVKVRAEIRGERGDIVGRLKSVSVRAGDSAVLELTGTIPDISPWSPDSPALYSVDVVLSEEGREIDRVEVRTGFRSVSIENGGLLLNGEPVFLTGFNRHEDSPITGMVFDAACVRQDLEQMKESGANMVRLCHYPHHPSELDLCDELGLLAFGEIPLYFWNDKNDGLVTNDQRVASAERQLGKMINRDRSHPSLIIWSVSNETDEQHTEVAGANRKLIQAARRLDPSRLCVHVSNHWRDHPNFTEDDLICINGYPSLDYDRKGREPGRDLTSSALSWRDGLARLADSFPNKPVLVTEFGYCSFPGTRGNSFGEDEHSRVLEAEFAAIAKSPHVCGALIWCWADHPWPGGRFLGGLPLSPFGVVTRSRHALEPFHTAGGMFKRKQKKEIPPRREQSDATNVVLLRSHLSDIPETPLPEGFELLPMCMAESVIWTDIQRDAEPFFPISSTLFSNQFGDDPAAVAWRCFILRNEKGLGIGTISAWYNRDFCGEEWGRIHWVAVRPAYQGRGLGKGMLTFALRHLAKWHDKAYLDTDTRRTSAIALYLKFGFVPDLSPANAAAVWRDFSHVYDHPSVREALRNRS